MVNIAEQKHQIARNEEGLTFSSLVDRPEFKHGPENAIVALINYGLDRYRAGIEGVWPSYVPSDITGGEATAPKLMASAFRVDGLGIALLALKHAEGAGFAVPDSMRDKVEVSIREYTQDGDRVIQDLAAVADLTADWGHGALAEVVRARMT